MSNAMQITTAWRTASPRPGRHPTIWEALATKLGREPSNAEATAEVRRILGEAADERRVAQAAKGTLPWRRRRG